jgi:PhnB protein
MPSPATVKATAPDALPAVHGGVAPYLMVDGAARAADFYKRAFAAEEAYRYPPDDKGRTMHIHLYINGGSVMLSDFYPEYGHAQQVPQAFNLGLPVTDVDAWWKRAVDAGCEIAMPLAKQFWGDRYGQVRDPFGVTWALFAPA